MKNSKSLEAVIKAIKSHGGNSQQLAARAGISPATIANVVAKRYKMGRKAAFRIAGVVGMGVVFRRGVFRFLGTPGWTLCCEADGDHVVPSGAAPSASDAEGK